MLLEKRDPSLYVFVGETFMLRVGESPSGFEKKWRKATIAMKRWVKEENSGKGDVLSHHLTWGVNLENFLLDYNFLSKPREHDSVEYVKRDSEAEKNVERILQS